MKKNILIILSIISFFVLILLSLFIYIAKKTNQPLFYFPRTIIRGMNNSSLPKNLNFIILGVDKRNDWLEKTQTTDTIIFSQLNLGESKLHLFSLPRDLWSYFIEAKINQIYPNSLDKDNSLEKFSYIEQNFASISGQPVDRVLVLSTENLKQLANILGGVDVYLENGFIDKEYPNEAYINNPNTDTPIYKTIEFKSGWIHLDDSNISEFVRSRKSANTAQNGGTDLGRIERQQLLINALIDKLKVTLSKKPVVVFDLYNYWKNLEHNFSDTELISYLLKYRQNLRSVQILRHPISTGEDPSLNLIYHPSKFINSQWVYLPQDTDYISLHQYISQLLASSP